MLIWMYVTILHSKFSISFVKLGSAYKITDVPLNPARLHPELLLLPSVWHWKEFLICFPSLTKTNKLYLRANIFWPLAPTTLLKSPSMPFWAWKLSSQSDALGTPKQHYSDSYTLWVFPQHLVLKCIPSLCMEAFHLPFNLSFYVKSGDGIRH